MGSSCRIECIFFSEFHPTLGPKITYQVPSTLPGLDEGRDALWSSAGPLEALWFIHACHSIHRFLEGLRVHRSRSLV